MFWNREDFLKFSTVVFLIFLIRVQYIRQKVKKDNELIRLLKLIKKAVKVDKVAKKFRIRAEKNGIFACRILRQMVKLRGAYIFVSRDDISLCSGEEIILLIMMKLTDDSRSKGGDVS